MTQWTGLPAGPVLERVVDLTVGDAAERLGVSTRQVSRWRNGQSGIAIDTADRVAIRLGLHLCELYPELYREAC